MVRISDGRFGWMLGYKQSNKVLNVTPIVLVLMVPAVFACMLCSKAAFVFVAVHVPLEHSTGYCCYFGSSPLGALDHS